jgi:hypothetical protein
MRVFLVLLLSLSSFNSNALFQDLYQGYKVSNRLQEIHLNDDITTQNFEYNLNKYDWGLDFDFSHSDSFLESVSQFQSQQTITQGYGLALTKQTFKYGAFSIAHKESTYDISNWSQSSLAAFGDDQLYESKNTFSYSYEILNRSLDFEYDEIHITNKSNRISDKITTHKDHYDFFSAYLAAKHRILIDRLNNEFKSRAQSRVEKLKKRVRDGLSRSVDLSSAQLSVLTQRENILKNEAILRQSVMIIENIIGITISKKDYRRVVWSFKPKTEFKFLFGEINFDEIEKLKALNHLEEIGLQKQKENSESSLNFNLSYAKNTVDPKQSEALNNSFGSGVNDEKVVSLVYSIPLGGEKRKALESKIRLQKAQHKLRITNRLGELNVQDKVLGENIDRYSSGIDILKQKVKKANHIASKTQSLYLRGKASFEDSLRTEEGYINAKVSLYSMYALYEEALAKKAFYSGKILTFLNGYKD